MANAQDYRSAAEDALRDANVELAIQQVSGAVALDPLASETQVLVDQLLSTLDDPLRQLDGEFYGLRALQACALARSGRLEDSLDRLSQVVTFRPDVPLLAWGADWFYQHEPARLWPVIATVTAEMLDALANPAIRSRGLVANAAALARLAEFAAQSPAARQAGMLLAAARIWSRIGNHTRALEILAAEERAHPSVDVVLERALVARSAGDLLSAAECFTRATELAPEEAPPQLDLAETLLGLGRFAEALTHLERASQLGAPRSDWAPAQAYARAALSREPTAARELLAAGDPASRRYYATLRVFDDVMFAPQDAVAKIVRDVLVKAAGHSKATPVRVALNGTRPPPPTAFRAFELGLGQLGMRGELKLNAPAHHRTSPLWRAEEGGWKPRLPPPPPELLAACERIASTEFDAATWQARAAELAPRDPEELFSVMCRPSPIDAKQRPGVDDVVDWVFRLQLVAAFGLLPLTAGQDALTTLGAGLDDWSATAAICALLSGVQGGLIDEQDLAAWLDQQLDVSEGESREYALLVARLRIPGLAPERQGSLWQRRSKLELGYPDAAWRLPRPIGPGTAVG